MVEQTLSVQLLIPPDVSVLLMKRADELKLLQPSSLPGCSEATNANLCALSQKEPLEPQSETNVYGSISMKPRLTTRAQSQTKI